MPITIKLNGGHEIHIADADFDALLRAFETALSESKPFEVRNPNGAVLIVNPNSVLYFEGPSHAAAAANGATPAAAAAAG